MNMFMYNYHNNCAKRFKFQMIKIGGNRGGYYLRFCQQNMGNNRQIILNLRTIVLLFAFIWIVPTRVWDIECHIYPGFFPKFVFKK
jgi:hypothetical protein